MYRILALLIGAALGSQAFSVEHPATGHRGVPSG